MFSFFRKKEYFSQQEKERILMAIQQAERQTSGEIRVFAEGRCRYVDPIDRAGEVFWGLQMDRTTDRNGVLLYIAFRDHQFAIFADKGIHERLGNAYWQQEVKSMQHHFKKNHYADAVVEVIGNIGQALREQFPFDGEKDKNELPDDIVFGD